ncbi:large proline-rich protein BAG6-like [Oppia nitens]|uniref:large proline-rich protein BAG6-like n=1 Tax=Oppia nitens TaxID=1686743 RepID=UPI0023DC95A9|nr:large proline-rich protein BAG6-like [Oppia nitens]
MSVTNSAAANGQQLSPPLPDCPTEWVNIIIKDVERQRLPDGSGQRPLSDAYVQCSARKRSQTETKPSPRYNLCISSSLKRAIGSVNVEPIVSSTVDEIVAEVTAASAAAAADDQLLINQSFDQQLRQSLANRLATDSDYQQIVGQQNADRFVNIGKFLADV